MERVFNPVGATYHPFRVAETKTTDTTGTVLFRASGSRDRFHFYTHDDQALAISLGERTILEKLNKYYSHSGQTS